jgi:hypothetical protein
MDTLTHRFDRAGLPIELRTLPLTDRLERAADIVQMDIARDERKHRPRERFRVYPGHTSNRLEVLGVDRAIHQLVLLVDEPRRVFTVRMPKHRTVPSDAKIVRTDPKSVWIEQPTPGRVRRFLCGMDEAHLFIAMLPDAVTTVRDAHASLRDPLIDEVERRSSSPTLRQGEWFFVAIPCDEEREVETLARRTLPVRRGVGIAGAASIRRIGREHVADEIVVVPPSPIAGNGAVASTARVYVRGAVRHPDHKTVVLRHWRRTIVNRESIEQPIEGIDWID